MSNKQIGHLLSCYKCGRRLSHVGGICDYKDCGYDPIFTDEQQEIVATLKRDNLKNEALMKLRKAEKAMYDYYVDCEIGKEREWASQVYENIRVASRVEK